MKKPDLSWIIGSLWFIGDQAAIEKCAESFCGKSYVTDVRVTAYKQSVYECSVSVDEGNRQILGRLS